MSMQYDPNAPSGIRLVPDGLGDCGCAWPSQWNTGKAKEQTTESMRPIGPRTCGCIQQAIQRGVSERWVARD